MPKIIEQPEGFMFLDLRKQKPEWQTFERYEAYEAAKVAKGENPLNAAHKNLRASIVSAGQAAQALSKKMAEVKAQGDEEEVLKVAKLLSRMSKVYKELNRIALTVTDCITCENIRAEKK